MIQKLIINTLKRFVSNFPILYQQELKRIYFRWQIRTGTFKSHEQEFDRLDEWVRAGDWVLDIGANVGHYSARLSGLVGVDGRVFAFEPILRTFELLSANMAQCPFQNITLLNVAVSESTCLAEMSIPRFETGLENYYEARLTRGETGIPIVCLSIDCLNIPKSIRLAKIDVEGHELSVLRGMEKLIRRDQPVLIVEGRGLHPLSWTKCVRVPGRTPDPHEGEKGSCHEATQNLQQRVQAPSDRRVPERGQHGGAADAPTRDLVGAAVSLEGSVHQGAF